MQSTVNINTALGVPGEIAFDGPRRALPYNLNSSGQDQIVGYAYTLRSDSAGNPDPLAGSPNMSTAQVGGTGQFLGLLVNPKALASVGVTGNPLGATLQVPDNTQGDLADMGEYFINLGNAANIGDQPYYDNTTGAIGSQAAAAGTATQSTTVVTVVTSTGGNIGVGSKLNIAGGVPVTVLSLGSGTGGAGTYNVDQSQTITPAAAFTGNATAPTGKTLIPRAAIWAYPVAVAGLAVIKLTN